MGEELQPDQPQIQDEQSSGYLGPEGHEISTPEEMQGAIESAAVRPAKERSASEDEEIDKALRARNPKPPLTDQDIASLTQHRGRPPTQEEIDGINAARARGIHIGI
ncbi:MAG TPA: hypothetical protein VFW90_03220 [Candidatus Saccharimonadales bacterium]|nr:hypothetical protein [Candidatus Saccharimonadales bacterium]